MSEINVAQQLLRCARKLIRRSSNSPDTNGGRGRTSIAKRSVVKALCVSILPTPTKEPSSDGTFMNSNHRDISMREITKQLGFSVGRGLRTLAVAQKKQADIADGDKDGWIMLPDDELRSNTKMSFSPLWNIGWRIMIWFATVPSRITLSSKEIGKGRSSETLPPVSLFESRR